MRYSKISIRVSRRARLQVYKVSAYVRREGSFQGSIRTQSCIYKSSIRGLGFGV